MFEKNYEQSEQLPEPSQNSPEFNPELNHMQLESTLQKLEECEDEAEGLRTITFEIVKAKGHFSPNLCQNVEASEGHIEINHLQLSFYLTRCLKITEKVSLNITSEERYI